jgi:hypothetical protein
LLVFSSAPSATAAPSWAFKAAALDCGCYPNSHTVALYQVAINALQPRCKEPPAKFVPEAWATHKDLAAHGKKLSTLGVIYYTYKSMPKSLGRTNCAQVMAALAILVESG